MLREIDKMERNLRARGFKPIIGGDYRLTVAFESNENEKLYGMGQYQQEIMNIKTAVLNLRTS